jgi:hypothetical protein
MGEHFDLSQLLNEIKSARQGLEARDTKTAARLDGVEKSVNDLFLRLNRPGSDSFGAGAGDERDDARLMCVERHALQHQKSETWTQLGPRTSAKHTTEIPRPTGREVRASL